jgi:polyisoprenyl-teichoic acid--peptidoglycan teichoic acid transferase
MKPPIAIVSVLILSLVVTSCSTAPAPTQPARTPVPTWTLAFDPATRTPVPPAIPAAAVTVEIAGPPTSAAEPTATDVLFPTPSPTARPGIDPTLGPSSPDPSAVQPLPIPDPMPQLRLDKDIVNILLLGRDTERSSNSYRTDVIIIASINKAARSVSLLTIPRDLFVYIPGWTMNRINIAANRGDAVRYPGGGVALLQQTILYNLGIPTHGWARVDFEGFRNIVDIVGGVDVPVSCAMQDWRLIDAALNDQDPDNWELYTVEAGVRHMDGDLALWYARSRKRSSDYDRSRRQHQVLRAIFDQALRLQMLTRVPEFYGQYREVVDTDLGLGDLLQFVPMGLNLDRANIKSRFIGRDHVFSWTTPAGAAVLLPNREAISALLAEAFLPPAQNVLAREAPSVEIWNGTRNADWSALAADNLAWAGIVPVIGQADHAGYAATQLYDYTTSAKGSAVREIQRIFRIKDENVIAMPEPGAPHAFRVVLGSDYNPCVAPQPIIRTTPTPWASTDPGPQAENVYSASPITGPAPSLDGDLAEWAVLPWSVSEPIAGADQWGGAGDASATWNAAWDEQFLYLAVRVKDDQFVQLSREQDLYRGDSIEIWFGANHSGAGGATSLGSADFILGISPGDLHTFGSTPEAYLWHPEAEARVTGDVIVTADFVLDGGYVLEIGVPWTLFRLTPHAGQTFGFALVVNDDDIGHDRQTQLAYRRTAARDNPSTWGTLVLGAPPQP